MVDWVRKLAHMVPIVGTATALETVKFFFNVWLKHHGLPRVIVLNQIQSSQAHSGGISLEGWNKTNV